MGAREDGESVCMNIRPLAGIRYKEEPANFTLDKIGQLPSQTLCYC